MKTIIIDGIEYNLTPKVAFYKGDWVVYDHRPYQVVELPKEGYINVGLRGNGKIEFAPSTYCRHWTIKDAKDGDVLVDEDKSYHDSIFIYRNMLNATVARCYVRLFNGSITTYEEDATHGVSFAKVYPATQSQKETLFKAMVDAGYIWDSEKKQLLEKPKPINIPKKTIVPIKEPAEWSEEDERMISGLLTIVEDWYNTQSQEEKGYYGDCGYINWLKSLKDRVLPQLKQEWDEEDKAKLDALIEIFKTNYKGNWYDTNTGEYIGLEFADWLKSLRPQSHWKPSEEQIKALYCAVHINPASGKLNYLKEENVYILEALYNDLKQLKEE